MLFLTYFHSQAEKRKNSSEKRWKSFSPPLLAIEVIYFLCEKLHQEMKSGTVQMDDVRSSFNKSSFEIVISLIINQQLINLKLISSLEINLEFIQGEHSTESRTWQTFQSEQSH